MCRSGTDTATVAITVRPVTNMGDWLDAYGIAAAPPDGDSDGDSVSNAIEYVIGEILHGFRTTRLPTAEMASIENNGTPTEYLCFTYRRTDVALAPST